MSSSAPRHPQLVKYFSMFKWKGKKRSRSSSHEEERRSNNGKTRVKELMSGQSGGLFIMTLSSSAPLLPPPPPPASIRRSKQGQRATGGRTSPDRGSLTVSSPLPSNRNIIHSHRLLTVFSRLSNRPPSSRDVSPDN